MSSPQRRRLKPPLHHAASSDRLNTLRRNPMTVTTPPAYSPGLAGVIAGESAICEVDPNAGLIYRGYDVEELAQKKTFEDVVWLLLQGELPNESQRQQLRKDLADQSPLPAPVVNML